MSPTPVSTSADRLGHILRSLEASLQAFHGLLTDPTTKKELFKSLHDDTGLPNKEVSAAAEKVVDLLGSIEHLLEPAPLRLADHFLGYTTTKCLVAAFDLNIADHLSQGPLGLGDLAARAHAKPDRLKQILRSLHTNNIFTYDENAGQYDNNHVSQLLRSDHWTQWRNWVDLYGNEFYKIAGGIPGAVKADGEKTRSAAQIVFDTDEDMFTYFQQQGWVPRLHRTLGGGAKAMALGILTDYPWEELADTAVLDIGGGGGALTASLLRAYPTMRGAIFDLPAVIKHVEPFFKPEGQFADVGCRVTHLIPGDFLEEIPSFTAYTIKWVLHDWNDADAAKILRNVRAAIKEGPGSRLVILESVLSDRRSGRLSVYGDINMMMTANGQERTEKQWRALAADSGWVTHSIHPLRNAWVQAIDLRPAPLPKDSNVCCGSARRTQIVKPDADADITESGSVRGVKEENQENEASEKVRGEIKVESGKPTDIHEVQAEANSKESDSVRGKAEGDEAPR